MFYVQIWAISISIFGNIQTWIFFASNHSSINSEIWTINLWGKIQLFHTLAFFTKTQIGIIANFVFPYICSFLLHVHQLHDVSKYWIGIQSVYQDHISSLYLKLD